MNYGNTWHYIATSYYKFTIISTIAIYNIVVIYTSAKFIQLKIQDKIIIIRFIF